MADKNPTISRIKIESEVYDIKDSEVTDKIMILLGQSLDVDQAKDDHGDIASSDNNELKNSN